MQKACLLLNTALLFLSFAAVTQTRYLAAYEQKVAIDLSAVKLNTQTQINISGSDSSTMQDSLLRLLNNRDFILQMIREKFSDSVTVYSHVWADSTNAELEYNSGGSTAIQAKKVYENGTWKHIDSLTKAYLPDTIKYSGDFIFLDSTKMIAGYSCRKAQSTATKLSVWFCKVFPKTVSPGLTIDKINAAIFELIDDDRKMHILLRSIQKLHP